MHMGFGIGAVADIFRKVSPAECNYSADEQELLVVVHAMQTWRCCLEGVCADMLTVLTHHTALPYLQTQTMLSRREVDGLEFCRPSHASGYPGLATWQ